MKYIILSVCALFTYCYATAQQPGDTILVKSIHYGTNSRDTVVNFPNLPGVNFEKIYMLYNMRCKGGLVSTGSNRNLGCGEWDYSCNTYISDSTKADSVLRSTSSHRISNFSGTTFNYQTAPALNRYRNILVNTTSTIISETQHSLGNSALNINHALPTNYYNGKSQYLYTAAELTAAGLSAGTMDGLLLKANQAMSANLLRVKMKHTTLALLDAGSPDQTGFQEVYFNNANLVGSSGGDRIQFNTPFVWDGISNVLIEFNYTNNTGQSIVPTLTGHSTTNVSGISSTNDQHFLFTGSNYINIPNYNGISGSNDRTVEAWVNTKVTDKEIVTWGGTNTSEKWVVRVNGGGQLRAEVGGGYIFGTTNIADSAWHHIAVVFSGNNIMQAQLYVDGQLETNGGIQGVAVNTNINSRNVEVGRGPNGTYFQGGIDNVRIWSSALSQTTIQNWMRRTINSTHPQYTQLQLDLTADEAVGGTTITDQSANNRNGNVNGINYWTTIDGNSLFKNFENYTERPDITFLRGTYNLTNANNTIWYDVEQIPYFVETASIISNSGTINSDVISYSQPVAMWDPAKSEVHFDENGNYLTTVSGTPDGTINITQLPYYSRTPMNFEIMSFVTPYGINLDLGPTGKTWSFDVTDFSPLLKGNKRMYLNKGGERQEDMDIQFMFIVGTPPQNVIDINNIWYSDRSSTYSQINSNAVFPPRTIDFPSTASSFKIRSSITGHGQEGEFIPRNHHLNVDAGSPEFSWTAWKECADNPVYPQGGTWIYDRAGWCPGMATDLQESILDAYVSPGQTHTIDYNVDVASGDSRYIVSHQLVTYGAANHQLDARVLDILNPSSKIEYARENPICNKPKVIIQNTGSTTLSSAQIEYGINDLNSFTQNWTGSLGFLETDTVEINLPSNFWDVIAGPTNNKFHAKITAPNNGTDEYTLNDKMYSSFELPLVFPDKFILLYRGNSAYYETKIEIIDASGNVVFNKIAQDNSTTYDTINLVNNGCYSLLVSDNDDDGINFWANNDGVGVLQLADMNLTGFYNLNGDFGKYSRVNFTVNWPLSYEEINNNFETHIYPNPTDDVLFIEANEIGKAEIKIVDALGRTIAPQMNRSTNKVQLNTSNLPSGFYYVQIQLGEKTRTEKFVIRR